MPNLLETQLILDACRQNIDDEGLETLRGLASSREINWNTVMMSALWHKVAFVVLSNLTSNGLIDIALSDGCLPLLVLNHWKQLKAVNAFRNSVYLDLLPQIYEAFERRNVNLLVSKGGPILIGKCYEKSERKMYDLDYIGSREDINDITEIFSELGFFMADLDYRNRCFIPISDTTKRSWLMHARGLPNLIKPIENSLMEYAVVQVQFVLGSTELGFGAGTQSMMERATVRDGFKRVDDIDLFIQLCLHIARETRESSFKAWGMSYNLVKACDLDRFVRYIISVQSQGWTDVLVERVANFGFLVPCYVACRWVCHIFGNSQLELIVSALRDAIVSHDSLELAELDEGMEGEAIQLLHKLSKVGESGQSSHTKWDALVGRKTI